MTSEKVGPMGRGSSRLSVAEEANRKWNHCAIVLGKFGQLSLTNDNYSNGNDSNQHRRFGVQYWDDQSRIWENPSFFSIVWSDALEERV